MRKPLYVLILSAALVSGLGMFTQAPSAAGQFQAAASTDAGQVAPAASTTLRMRGTIDRYDASTGMLFLATSTGTVQLPIASTTRIRQRRDKIDAMTLKQLVGCRVAIRYSESGGNTIVESVQVFGKDERTKR